MNIKKIVALSALFITATNQSQYTEPSGMFGDLNLRFGLLLEELELNGKIQYQWDMYTTALGTEDRNGLKRSSLGLKYMIYDPYKYYEKKENVYSWKANHKYNWHQWIPAVSFYAGANFNLNNQFVNYTNDANIGPKLALITQNQFDSGFVLVLNLISDNISS